MAKSTYSYNAEIAGSLETTILNVASGEYDLSGSYSASTAPLALNMTLPRPTTAPEGKRNILQWTALQDVVVPENSTNQAGSLNFLDILQRSGYRFTKTTNNTTSAGSATLNFASTTGITVGMFIDDASGGIPAGATVSSVTSTTVVASEVAVGSGVASGASIAFRGAVADSWGGSRTIARLTWTEDNHPVEYAEGPADGTPYPSVNVLWSTIQAKYSRGGTEPAYKQSRGSNFLNYGMVQHISGAVNLTSSRLYEGSLFFQQNTSVRAGIGWSLHTPVTAGTAPTEVYVAYTGRKTSNFNLSWRGAFLLGEQGYGGLDSLRGTLLGYTGSHADTVPNAFQGVSLSDTAFSGNALSWIGGDISGGTHTDVDAGRLRLGNGFLTPTSTGLDIDAAGYRGSPPGTTFSLGVDLINGNPVIPIRNNSLGDDEYGGTYKFFAADFVNNEFTRVLVLNPPVVQGAAPSNPIEVKLRHNSGAIVEFPVTETATTTEHPTELTATSSTAYNGRYLAYYTGAAAGEKQLILDFDPETRILTTDPFSVVPTTGVNLIVNPKFTLALPVVENSILNGWQYTLNGGTGSVTREQVSPGLCAQLISDGTNPVDLDQSITWPTGNGILYLVASGSYTIKIGTSRGATDIAEIFITQPIPPPGEDPERIPQEVNFYTAATTVWIRFENTAVNAVQIYSVRCADVTSGSDILLGVRAGVEAVPLTVNHTWTQRNELDLQSSGGPTTVGGDLNVLGDLLVTQQTPANSSATGMANTIAFDSNYIYVCVATNTWKRVALSSF